MTKMEINIKRITDALEKLKDNQEETAENLIEEEADNIESLVKFILNGENSINIVDDFDSMDEVDLGDIDFDFDSAGDLDFSALDELDLGSLGNEN